MVKLLWGIIKTARPRQWIKNFALFAGLIFSGQFEYSSSFILILQSFIIFCGLSSATYFLNDVFDVERDRQHPFKRLRPIAAGIVPIPLAIALALTLTGVLLPFAYSLNPTLFYAGVAYLLLQLVYSAYLKSAILLDVMVIAAGFVLRVYAGVWTIDAHLNVWFLLCVISFSLFLAIGKRRSELTLMSHQTAGKHRETLLHYPESLLDILTAMFANSTWLTYALFAFQQPPILVKSKLIEIFNNDSLPLNEAKYLMITVPIVIYGVMRYLYIIYEKKEGESPERVLLTDTPLLATVLFWFVSVLFIIYYLGG
ncbi:MAG: decaprenyl-phosphate phosphoribosyltransferase [Candidatus Daviesbacteria bacterium]|nr:decaprenyl-phosphate phosphoribosyltransferase [Candidatus Daviesbacteria bacterium]